MSPTSSPLVGFVIATRNAAGRLQDCLNSIYAQDDTSWEIAVIDGASTDGTVEVIQHNASRLKYWISEPDHGVYDAWNKAIPHLTAQWFQFLGADDFVYSPSVISRMRPVLAQAHPGHRIVYGSVALIGASGQLIEHLGKPWPEIEGRFKKEMCIPHQGIFHHRELFHAGARFDASFRIAGDYEFLLREFKDRAPYSSTGICVAAWRHGGISSRPQNGLQVFREFRTARLRHGLSAGVISWSEAKAVGKLLLGRLFGTGALNRIVDGYRIASNRPPVHTPGASRHRAERTERK